MILSPFGLTDWLEENGSKSEAEQPLLKVNRTPKSKK
jgi:hypothetical protein